MIWIIAGAIIALFILFKIFGSGAKSSTPTSGDFIALTPANNASAVYITPEGWARKQITETTNFYSSDASASVEAGNANGTMHGSKLDIDENTEITYKTGQVKDASWTNDKIKLNKWRLLIESHADNLFVELNNFTAKIPSGTTIILEQTNIINSVAYAIAGNAEIMTDVGQQTLKAGEKILISPSDVKNTQTKLSELVGPVDASLENLKIFTRNNWKQLLTDSLAAGNTEIAPETASWETLSGSTTSTGLVSTGSTTKYISFTQPVDGATIKTQTTTIIGTILSTDVARVTLNDIDAAVSPVNENFTMENLKLASGINNIVYKVYNSNSIELEKWVLVIYGPKGATAAKTIVPENFPNLKDFVITSPAANPYATTESYVKVQWSVPKNTVKYITVNDYKLQKFAPNSTVWYYHANASIGTIKEGTNLYHIKFYDANDKLIHTQIFTIIKDSKNATATATSTSTTTKKEETTPLLPTIP